MSAFARASVYLRAVAAPAKRRDLLTVIAIFVAGRLSAFAAGVRFDASDLAGFWHFAPLHLLQTRLLETIFYLHFQPPLFNLYLGCVVKLFGSASTHAFAVSFLLLGLTTALALFVLMRRLGLERRWALVLTSVFVSSPATLLFESYLFYELPVAALLVCSALALHVALERRSSGSFAVFFGLLAALVLTRALFHPLVLVAAALGPLLAFARQRRALLRGFAVPALLVAALCAKNQLVFAEPSTSTWLGMGLARMTLRTLDPEQKAAWVREGLLSPVAAVHPPSSLAAYANVMRMPDKTGIPILDEEQKPDGSLNLHHLAYAHISHTLLADDLVVLRRAPAVYFAAADAAFRRFFQPASSWHPLAKNRIQLAAYDRLYSAIVHIGNGRALGVLFFAALGWAAFQACRPAFLPQQRAVIAFMALTMSYVLFSGTLLEPLENMRFRFAVEPFLWIIVGLSLGPAKKPTVRLQARAISRRYSSISSANARRKLGRSRRRW